MEAQGQLLVWFFFLHLVGPGCRTEVVRLGGKSLSLPNYLLRLLFYSLFFKGPYPFLPDS